MSTRPFFIVSSGRSGTAMLSKALAAAKGVTIEHEYMVHLIQPLAIKRYHGLVSPEETRSVLQATYGAALRYAETPLWGDSSNKASWLIPDLAGLFPEARFVHLVRDGRKVASSYFHKLGRECYDDRSNDLFARYLADPEHVAAPPPEKKYWWPQPKDSDAEKLKFKTFDQFQRIVWHWSEINRVILRDLNTLPEDRSLFVRLEELRETPEEVEKLFAFLGAPYQPEHFAAFQRPHNVNRPTDTPLTPEQNAKFGLIAYATMETLGYASRPEYVMNY